ncbi:hypothetical protein PSI15_10875 [Xenorhabdus sp. PR6a]|uniref:hypothetical protein n=1 Tax=Xenorhabdus sp. PR6a TaxID=3025877 RepID=UPI00235831E0|nr:hypothetical protein [Xenorhabdus sp. PR6a]MDC9582061.1 hypothetical protein [Xenorhabdus sp. PR6a]
MSTDVFAQQIDDLVNAPETNHGTHLMVKDVLIEYVAQLDADLYWSRERTDPNTYPERKATLDRQIANLTTLRNYLYDTVAEFIDAGRVINICDAIRAETLPVSAEN